jgi:broad specificity phosphatase PhoE
VSAGTVVLLRHGQTEWNAFRRLQGQADIELDEVGLAQADRAAQEMARLRPAAFVSSDLVRAARTAQRLGEVSGLPVTIDERLRERSFGHWEGLVHAEIEGGWPTEYALWSRGGQPDGVGLEPRGDVGTRVAEAVVEHAERLEADATLVLVTHGAAISAGIATLLGQDAGSWNGISGLGNCHWSVLHPTRTGTPAWRLTAHNVAPPA